MSEKVKTYGIKVLVVLGIFATGAAFGKFAGPSKVEYKDKIVYQDKIVTQTDEDKTKDLNKNVVTTKTETDKPDGTKVIQTVTQDKSTLISSDKTDTKSTNTVNSTEEKSEVKIYSKNDWMLSVIATKDLSNLAAPFSFGGLIQRRILGPIYLGVLGTSNKEVGVGVGLSF